VPFTFVFAIIAAEILQPFDFSLDLGGIYTHVKTLLHDPFQWPSVIRDEPAILLFYMVLTSYALKLNRFSSAKLSGGKIVLLMFLIVFSLESVQFIIMSRMPGGTDILTGVTGVLCGVLFYKMNVKLQRIILTVLIFISAFCKYFSPFELASQYNNVNLIPFLAEYSQTTMTSLGNVLELTVLFVFAGYCTFTFFSTRIARVVLIFIWGFMIFSFEFLQGFIAGRIPDLSDVLVGVAALFAGVLFKVRFEERLQEAIGRKSSVFLL
jgi:VanZ family protein